MQNKGLKLKVFFLATLILGIGFGVQARAATYYVAPGGNNANAGSQSAPFLSLSYACGKALSSGDLIQVAAGNYTDNSTCNLKVGVKIQGAGSSLAVINTSASRFISAVSSLPVVNGSNEISGLNFKGNGSNTAVYSEARSNQKIHDNAFSSFSSAINIRGKTMIWSGNCASAPPTQTASYCDDTETLDIEPATTDWATGIEIYSNQLTNTRIYPLVIKDSSIHDNTIDNSTSLMSGVGNTSYWWNNVQFYNNKITMQTIAWSTIALEVWMVEGDTKFYNNTTNGWFSILKNPHGPKTPYSWEITGNTFSSNVVAGLGSGAVGQALETCYFADNVLVADNYFVNTGSNMPYQTGIGIHGKGPSTNFLIRNNVFYNLGSDAIEINSNDASGVPFTGSNINIYNNVMDTINAGVLIAGSAPGTVMGVNIKNNLFSHMVGSMPFGAITMNSPSNVAFTNNVVYAGSYTTGGGFSSISNNYNFSPGITLAGLRPDPFYRPVSASNLIDKGINVGLAFSGLAPDIGAYEYGFGGPIDTAPAAPTGLIVN